LNVANLGNQYQAWGWVSFAKVRAPANLWTTTTTTINHVCEGPLGVFRADNKSAPPLREVRYKFIRA
jgi:hypothetical protein